MIAIIDYGAGNLFSVKNALDYLGISNVITNDKAVISECDKIILPGVGAFPTAMQKLHATGIVDFLIEQAQIKPFLGICLGMQMLFDEGTEFGMTKGLGLISGTVKEIVTDLKIPHMGWNKLEFNLPSPILSNLEEKSVYFVHSFMAYTDPQNVVAYCDYEQQIPALVQNKLVYGCQFHPEKSGDYGTLILKNFGGL